MVSQIQLGQIFQENGRTVIGGSQSGFDTQSLINSLVSVKQQPATDLTAANKTIDDKVTAFGKLNTLLATFQTAADSLRNPPGVNNASQNSFQFRTTNVTASNGASASNYVSVSAQPGASIQNFTIDQIKTLAQQSKQHSNVFNVADTTTISVVGASGSGAAHSGMFAAGDIVLKNLSGGTNPTITLAEGDTLSTVANKFNAVKSQTGIQANILQISDNQYELTFTATNTGTANGFDFTTGAGAGHSLISDTSGVLTGIDFTNTQSAQNADLFVDGIEVTRSSNSIDDILPDVTINLNATTPVDGLGDPTASLNVSIQPDTSTVTTAVQSFADAYNNLLLFISAQSQRNADGSPATGAVLAQDTTMRSISDSINQQVTQIVGGLAVGGPQTLADIGISFTNYAGDDTNPATSNIMNIDATTLSSALSSNFDGVANLFEFNMTSDNPHLTVFSHTKELQATSFSITKSGTTFTANIGGVAVPLTATALASGGYSLTTPSGSAIEGLTLLYTSNTDATMNVNLTQGIGDSVYNSIQGMINTTDGTVTHAVKSLSDTETKNNDKITQINDQVASYKDQITQQYANLESALTKANSLLALLTAQSNAQLAASGN